MWISKIEKTPQSSKYKNLISIAILKLQNPNILLEQEKVLYNSLRQVLNLSHITNNQGNQNTSIQHNVINQPETNISSSLSTPTPSKNSNEIEYNNTTRFLEMITEQAQNKHKYQDQSNLQKIQSPNRERHKL